MFRSKSCNVGSKGEARGREKGRNHRLGWFGPPNEEAVEIGRFCLYKYFMWSEHEYVHRYL